MSNQNKKNDNVKDITDMHVKRTGVPFIQLNRTHKAEVEAAFYKVEIAKKDLEASDKNLRNVVMNVLQENNATARNSINIKDMKITPPEGESLVELIHE